jgi:hypothetical protein
MLLTPKGDSVLLGQVNGGVVERSVVHDVRWLADSPYGGPGAIWTANSNRVTLQYNEAYNDEVRVYNRLLNPAEINVIYSSD